MRLQGPGHAGDPAGWCFAVVIGADHDGAVRHADPLVECGAFAAGQGAVVTKAGVAPEHRECVFGLGPVTLVDDDQLECLFTAEQ